MPGNNEKAVEISANEFESTISQPLVVIDFYAEWCMPCLMMAPIIEEMAEKFPEIKFAKINVDDNSEISRKFKVMSIPTIIFFKQGKEVERITGSLSSEQLEEKLKVYIK